MICAFRMRTSPMQHENLPRIVFVIHAIVWGLGSSSGHLGHVTTHSTIVVLKVKHVDYDHRRGSIVDGQSGAEN